MIHIYDANGWLRRSLNRGFNLDPRILFAEANAGTVPAFWVWDGPGNNGRRRAIFPGYKIRDYTGQEQIFEGLKMYRELLGYSKAIQIEVPKWEADDVCFTLAKHFLTKGEEVTVFTNDFDFHQLRPYVTVKGIPTDIPYASRHTSLYKALRGDSSDKIPGLPGFGEKSWEAFAHVWDELDRAFMAKDADFLRQQPFRKGILAWLESPENVDLLFSFYEITQMFEVPMGEIEQHMRPGVSDAAAADQLLTRYLL